MFWHDFRQGGGARAIVMFVVGGAEGMVSIYLVGTIHRYIIEYSLDKLILREKKHNTYYYV